MNFFNDFFQEQEDEENRQKRSALEEEQKQSRNGGLRNNQQAIMPLQNREQLLQEDIRSQQLTVNKSAASGNMANPEIKQRMEQLRLQREIVGVLITSFVWEIDPRYVSVMNISND